MVKFAVTEEIRAIIREYNEREGDEVDENVKAIEHVQLARIAQALRNCAPDEQDYTLHNILKSTSIYIEPKPVRKIVLQSKIRVTLGPSPLGLITETSRAARIRRPSEQRPSPQAYIPLLRRRPLRRRQNDQKSDLRDNQYPAVYDLRIRRHIHLDEIFS
jgi:hypothetical protein